MRPNINALPTIQSEINSNETLLWNGQPQSGIKLRASDIFLIPFSLMWGGFAIFWEASVIATRAPFFFKLWGIPFVLIGLYLILGRFFVDAKMREKTSYAVTDQRILMVSELFGRKIQSLNLRNLPQLTLDEKADGSGSILFGASGYSNAWGNASWPTQLNSRHSSPQVPSFEMIGSVRRVYNIIQEAQHAAP